MEVEGGVYHVYNRVARGEGVFSNPEEAVEFVDRIRDVKQRDGWTVFAWCLMSNHFHLAVRTATVGLATSLHSLQGKFPIGDSFRSTPGYLSVRAPFRVPGRARTLRADS